MPSVVVMMVMVVYAAASHLRLGRSHGGSRDCNCGKSRDEFHLVHDVVPFGVSRKPILALTKG